MPSQVPPIGRGFAWAGRLIAEALRQAAIDRQQAYVTNVLKHFKYITRGPHRVLAQAYSARISNLCVVSTLP